ncbi:MAG: PP2C family protein-serine/threonine phosphatase [Candidatus Eisenbacteria bacterium]|uniref:PP2C family protein-serine/threonine phosphatase n=1 Tax=Eiseniibacteriota bacterium TaxID=2212470 RepID=A0A849SLD9_UNCEI|nr:PP2C family protein-serine/threonine phosphatase [Candidatus Eisenbacteria bacterium]
MIESKAFYRRIEAALREVGQSATAQRFAEGLAPHLLQHLGGPIGVTGLQLYCLDGACFARAAEWGDRFPNLGEELDARLRVESEDPISDLPWAGEMRLGRVGLLPISDDGSDPLLALIAPPAGELRGVPSRGEFASVLSSIRYAILQHRHRSELEGLFEQARAVQMSLLPAGRPTFADYDICAVCLPAQSVGGDVYDFLPLDEESLAIAIADASGHGLPAALQARDVITGLRMGVQRDLKVTRMIEKLNRVIHQSGLTTRFVSMVFGELERNGNFSYVNAGHPAPLLIDDRGIHELSVGGMILGPDPKALYKLGFAHLDRGSALVLFSDGVPELGTESGTPFGDAGLREWLTEWREGPCDHAINDLLVRLRAYAEGESFEDDVTIVMVRRPK